MAFPERLARRARRLRPGVTARRAPAVRASHRGPQPHSVGLSKEAAIRMAISTARNVLAGIDGKLDPSIVNREVL
jgi:hypothetical protein